MPLVCSAFIVAGWIWPRREVQQIADKDELVHELARSGGAGNYHEVVADFRRARIGRYAPCARGQMPLARRALGKGHGQGRQRGRSILPANIDRPAGRSQPGRRTRRARCPCGHEGPAGPYHVVKKIDLPDTSASKEHPRHLTALEEVIRTYGPACIAS